MGVVEGTSYSLVILAAIGFGVALLWTAVSSLLIQPKEYTCFNVTLDKLRDDPRVTVRLGTPISGYGQESRNRAARQRIPHRAYNDDNGTEHFQVMHTLNAVHTIGAFHLTLLLLSSAWRAYALVMYLCVC